MPTIKEATDEQKKEYSNLAMKAVATTIEEGYAKLELIMILTTSINMGDKEIAEMRQLCFDATAMDAMTALKGVVEQVREELKKAS